jgi:hypothetical protein
MRKLSIFDDGARVATITSIGNGSILIFGITASIWRQMNRLVNCTHYPVGKDKPNFLDHVAEKAHEYNYSTELVDE